MAVLFRRSNGIYYHITHHDGRRTWRSTGKRRRIEAEEYLRKLNKESEQPAEHISLSRELGPYIGL